MENIIPAEPIIPQPESQPVIKPIQPVNLPHSSSKSKWVLVTGIIIVLILISLGGAYILSKNQKSLTATVPNGNSSVGNSQNSGKNSINGNTTQTTNPTPTPTPDPTANWKTYTGTNVSFKYPDTWNPIPNMVIGGGSGLENIKLGIPNVVSDQDLGFSGVNYTDIKITDSVKQTFITIGGKQGTKWLRKGNNYVSYDYYTTGITNQGSFGVHVTVSVEDKNLENQLDLLVASIRFTNQTSQTDPTANWQIYKNAYVNFTIKYPPNFYLEPPSPRGGADYIGDSKTSVEDIYLSGKKLQNNELIVTLIPLETNINTLQGIANRISGNPQVNVAYTPITIAGYQAVKVINNNIETYGILVNGKSFWISAQPASSTQIQTFQTMLSTIKFTQ